MFLLINNIVLDTNDWVGEVHSLDEIEKFRSLGLEIVSIGTTYLDDIVKKVVWGKLKVGFRSSKELYKELISQTVISINNLKDYYGISLTHDLVAKVVIDILVFGYRDTIKVTRLEDKSKLSSDKELVVTTNGVSIYKSDGNLYVL